MIFSITYWRQRQRFTFKYNLNEKFDDGIQILTTDLSTDIQFMIFDSDDISYQNAFNHFRKELLLDLEMEISRLREKSIKLSKVKPPSEPCEICGKEMIGFEYQMCCSGHECGCMGKPIEPCICSKSCWEEFKRLRDSEARCGERMGHFPTLHTG